MSLVYTYQVTSTNTAPVYHEGYVYGKPRPLSHWRKQYDESCRLKTEVFKSPVCDGIKIENTCVGGTNSIRRTGTTNLNKKYYASTHHYLQSRQKTYTQNSTLGENIKENTYTSNGSDCVVYKPSNTTFKTQGGVSASLNTAKHRNDAITKNTNSFRDPYLLSGANFGLHHGNAPYFLKSKENKCTSCD
jgi:hypothetical protein